MGLPCVIGVAQQTVRPGEGEVPEPLAWWERVASDAAADAGAPTLLPALESIRVVYCQSWQYDDPVGRLAERLDADPRHRTYTGIGGTVPLAELAAAADDIAAGRLDAALVVGAEALATKRALKRAGERPAWAHRHPSPPPFPMERMPHAAEMAHQLFQAWETFPLFDVARRARLGRTLEDERRERGGMMAPMTAVAAANPHAWTPVQRSAEELVTPAADNRLVGWPYTKHTVAVMDVDMAAAAIVVSDELADRLGIAADRRVYLRGYAYAEDPWTVAAHSDLSGSPAMRWTAAEALRQAGVSVAELTALDVYSCFGSSLRFGCDALGIDPLDPRGLTVTGGLPYAGGPASNYTLHAVASMVERLRRTPGHGLVTGVGMHMTKHAYAVFSSTPGGGRPPAPVPPPAEEVPVVETCEGTATVATYTVAHGRDGAAQSGLLVLDLPGGSRSYARVLDTDLLADAESRELVGTQVTVSTDGGVNTAVW